MRNPPPEETKWKEGDPSPNPSGRPKGSRNRSTVAREMLALLEKVKNPITEKHETLDQEAIMTLAILNKARKGDVRAYQALMDSAFGQPKQTVEVEGDKVRKLIKLPDGTEIDI